MDIEELLKEEARSLLEHKCSTIPKEALHLPGSDFVDRVFALSDRSPRVLGSLQRIFGDGRLPGTGYLSILPVNHGVEHSAGASFALNPDYFDPKHIVELAIEGGCNAAAQTAVIKKRAGAMGLISGRKAFQRPMKEGVKLLHMIQDIYLDRNSTIA